MTSARVAGRACLGTVTACVLLITFGSAQAERQGSPARADKPVLRERVESRLLQIAVEVRDKNGRFIHGLGLEDFSLGLDGRRLQLVAVDELCEAASSPNGRAAAVGQDAQPGEAHSGGLRRRYVLYLEFSLLSLGARFEALDLAARFVRETLPDGAEAALVATSTTDGLRLLVDFTRDRERLLGALARIRDDPEFIFTFPDRRRGRIAECLLKPFTLCRSACSSWATQETQIMVTALNRLRRLFELLPGTSRTATELIWFHETGALFPSEVYSLPVKYSFNRWDAAPELEPLGAAAMSAGARIHTISLGSVVAGAASEARNLGANFSQRTGGFNCGTADRTTCLERIVEDGRCRYLLAIRPPRRAVRRLSFVRVDAPGTVSPRVIPLRFLDEEERWKRDALRALQADPPPREIPVGAVFTPRLRTGCRWVVDVELVFPASAVSHPRRFATAGGADADSPRYVIGVLVADPARERTWEHERAYRLTGGTALAVMSVAVRHRGRIELPDGRYVLDAYAGDLHSREFGVVHRTLELPPADGRALFAPRIGMPGHPAVLHDVIFERPRTAVRPLPPVPLPEGGSESAPPVIGKPEAGTILEAETLACAPRGQALDEGAIWRIVTVDDRPAFRPEPVAVRRADACTLFVDRFAVPERVAAGRSVELVVLWREGSATALERRTPIPTQVVAGAARAAPGYGPAVSFFTAASSSSLEGRLR